MDVNRDGRPDVVSSGWMRMKGVYWYENPGKPGVKWKARGSTPRSRSKEWFTATWTATGTMTFW